MNLKEPQKIKGIIEIYDSFDAYFIDLWGVIHNGLQCYPAALEVLKKLKEQNLDAVILLNPKNEEVIFNLAKLKLETSDYLKSKELNNKLSILCNKLCGESKKLKIEIENLSKK